MESSPFQAFIRAVGYVAWTLPLMPVQALFVATGSPLGRKLPHLYHRVVCRILGVEIVVRGAISPARPTLFVANHVSYLDIETLSAAVPTCFVAKREIASWPVFGWLAKLQRTVFVERRASSVAGERDDLSRRLDEGDNFVLFAEATSSDGNRLRPFKSALFSVAERARGEPLMVQPVSIAYTRLDSMPLGRQWRPFVAWYGDMNLAPHLWKALGMGRITAVLEFHEPVTLAQFGSRKELAGYCQQVIAEGLEAANAGRDRKTALPPPAVAEPFRVLPSATDPATPSP